MSFLTQTHIAGRRVTPKSTSIHLGHHVVIVPLPSGVAKSTSDLKTLVYVGHTVKRALLPEFQDLHLTHWLNWEINQLLRPATFS
jgi:hypothetical protein